MNEKGLEEDLLPLLSRDAKPEVRCAAMEYFLKMTGSPDGLNFIGSNVKYLNAVIDLIKDYQPAIIKDALLALVNLTRNESVIDRILTLSPSLCSELLSLGLDSINPNAFIVFMLLTNISRIANGSSVIWNAIQNSTAYSIEKLVTAFAQKSYNKNCTLDYISPMLSNLTSIEDVRHALMDRKACVIQRLLPFVQYQDSCIIREGAARIIRNCCFDSEFHSWLLSDEVDILPHLLLPLAGSEEFDEKEMEKLPVDLQYLEADKKREEVASIRIFLIETLHQLCATKSCRQHIRDSGTYLILRELHQWEENKACSCATENLVQLLISDEPDQEFPEDMREIEIPVEIQQKFEQVEGPA